MAMHAAKKYSGRDARKNGWRRFGVKAPGLWWGKSAPRVRCGAFPMRRHRASFRACPENRFVPIKLILPSRIVLWPSPCATSITHSITHSPGPINRRDRPGGDSSQGARHSGPVSPLWSPFWAPISPVAIRARLLIMAASAGRGNARRTPARRYREVPNGRNHTTRRHHHGQPIRLGDHAPWGGYP